MTVALRLSDVDVRFSSHRSLQGPGAGSAPVAALSGVNLTINAGERVALVGRSGAGKSTITRLACGLTTPSAGTVTALGVNVGSASSRELRALRRRMHLVFQDPYQSLHPGLRIRDIVGEPLRIDNRLDEKVIHAALLAVGLTPAAHFMDRRPGSLSGGQRQRVAIARALVAQPKIILADEPTSMLDASLRGTIADLLLELQREQNAALLFVTHDLALARHAADRIIVLADGRVAEDAPTETLLADPQHEETQFLLTAARHSHAPFPH